MSYTKHAWVTGETITAEKLNNIEDGVDDVTRQLSDKQKAPSTAGTAGQVLGLDDQLQPVWVDQTGGGGDNSNCAPLIINTASGSVASFSDGADNLQIRKIVGTIETAVGGNGWTGANIYFGQNLIDFLSYFVGKSGITIKGDNTNGYTLTGSASKLRDVEIPIPDALIGKTIQITSTMSPKTNGNIRWSVIIGGSVINLESTTVSSGNVKRVSDTVTVTQSGGKFKLDYSTGDKEASISNIMISGVGNGDYAPYKPFTIIPVSWQSEAGIIINGVITLNEDGSADIVNSDSGISYHLTNIGTLLTHYGANNIFIDRGSITECKYPADTKLYIDNKIAELQALILEH